MKPTTLLFALLLPMLGMNERADAADAALIRSAHSGPWSAVETWEGGKVPSAGARVQVRTGHAIVYDVKSPDVLRSVHVAGTLSIRPGPRHAAERRPSSRSSPATMPAKTASIAKPTCRRPIPTSRGRCWKSARRIGPSTPVIRPSFACITSRAWTRNRARPSSAAAADGLARRPAVAHLAQARRPANKGDTAVTLAEAVTGWRPGDRIILTATTRQNKVQEDVSRQRPRQHANRGAHRQGHRRRQVDARQAAGVRSPRRGRTIAATWPT